MKAPVKLADVPREAQVLLWTAHKMTRLAKAGAIAYPPAEIAAGSMQVVDDLESVNPTPAELFIACKTILGDAGDPIVGIGNFYLYGMLCAVLAFPDMMEPIIAKSIRARRKK